MTSDKTLKSSNYNHKNCIMYFKLNEKLQISEKTAKKLPPFSRVTLPCTKETEEK